jgi:hypothetical protein
MTTKLKMQKSENRPPGMQIIRRYCVPIHVVQQKASIQKKAKVTFTGGSALLLETLVGRFIVTAFHVWQELSTRMNQSPENCRIVTYGQSGPVPLDNPMLVDGSEDLDLAILTTPRIRDISLDGKEFLRTAHRPMVLPQRGEIIMGCGYPKTLRSFEGERGAFDILYWANRHWDISQTGARLMLHAQHEDGKVGYSMKSKPKQVELPGISGAPLFVLRDKVDWVGVVRSGHGSPLNNGYSIQATPSDFIAPDGRIRKA